MKWKWATSQQFLKVTFSTFSYLYYRNATFGFEPFAFEQGRNRKIFLRGQSYFSPAWNAFIPVGNFHFGTPKTNFSHFEKWKQKKKKKKKRSSPHFGTILAVLKSEKQKKKKKKKKRNQRSSPHLWTFPSFHFQFSFFSSPFSIFSLPLFPGRAGEISQSPGQKSGGALCPRHPPPHLLRHCIWTLPGVVS